MFPNTFTGGLISLITVGYAAKILAHSPASSIISSLLKGNLEPGA
jgi:hypothetical protein